MKRKAKKRSAALVYAISHYSTHVIFVFTFAFALLCLAEALRKTTSGKADGYVDTITTQGYVVLPLLPLPRNYQIVITTTIMTKYIF